MESSAFSPIRTNPLHWGTFYSSMDKNEDFSFPTNNHDILSGVPSTTGLWDFPCDIVHHTSDTCIAAPTTNKDMSHISPVHVRWANPLVQIKIIPARGDFEEPLSLTVNHQIEVNDAETSESHYQVVTASAHDDNNLAHAFGALALASSKGTTSQPPSAPPPYSKMDPANNSHPGLPLSNSRFKKSVLLQSNLRHLRAKFPQPTPPVAPIPTTPIDVPPTTTPQNSSPVPPHQTPSLHGHPEPGIFDDSVVGNHEGLSNVVIDNHDITVTKDLLHPKGREKATKYITEDPGPSQPSQPTTSFTEIGQNGTKRKADLIDGMCCDGSPQPYKKRKFVHILSDSPSSSSSSSPLSQFLHPSNDHITSTNPSVSGGHISKSQHVFDTDSEQASDVMDIEEPTIRETPVSIKRGRPRTTHEPFPFSVESPIETSSIHGDHRFPTARSDCVGDESSNVEAENDRHDSRSCTQEIAAMDRRVRRWANDLDYIYTQRHSIVRDAAREAQLIQADELLGILRDIDDNKHWITKAEATQSRLAGKVRNMLKTIDRELEMESKKVARRILDDFAQRFMGERYPRRS